jgi:hypothetical protein
VPVHSLLSEKAKIDLKHGLEETHIGTLIKTDLVLPEVDDQDLR